AGNGGGGERRKNRWRCPRTGSHSPRSWIGRTTAKGSHRRRRCTYRIGMGSAVSGGAGVSLFGSRIASYFVITPQAMRSPELPVGSVFWSSALACTTRAVPPLLKTEWLSLPRLTSLFSILKCALPSAPTVKLRLSPAWWPSGLSNPCFLPSGLKCPPADLKSGASHFAF